MRGRTERCGLVSLYNSYMSWAARRRLLYIVGILVVLFIVVVLPLATKWYLALPSPCPTGTARAAGNTDGPCDYYVEAALQPHSVLWARAFELRPGFYDAVAYIQNPNPTAGVFEAPYQFSFYDSNNVLVAQKSGTTFIMPGSVTPVFLGNISSGNREIVHAAFALGSPLTWQKMKNVVNGISVNGEQASNVSSAPRVTAIVTNTTVTDIQNLIFVAVIYDPAGNAIASSQTALPQGLAAGQSQEVSFTWPSAFPAQVGRIDILPEARPLTVRN